MRGMGHLIRNPAQAPETTDDEHSAARNIERLEQAKVAAEETTARLMALQRMTADLADATSRVTVAEIIVDHLGAMLPNCKALAATLSADGDYVDCVRGMGHSRESIDRFDRQPLSISSRFFCIMPGIICHFTVFLHFFQPL